MRAASWYWSGHFKIMRSFCQHGYSTYKTDTVLPAGYLYNDSPCNFKDAPRSQQPLSLFTGIRSLVPHLIGPPSHWSPSHWSPNSLVPQYIIGAHWYPISLVPHLIGPPFHLSHHHRPIPMVPHLIGPPSHWFPISLVPQLISPPSHWSPN